MASAMGMDPGTASGSTDRRTLAMRQRWRFFVDTYAHRLSEGKWVPYPHLRYTLRTIQEAIRQGGGRVIVNEPPRHGKSEGISHWLPTWYLDWYPEGRVILASYNDSFAAKWGRKVRDEFTRNPQTWTRLRQDTTAVNDWQTNEGGGMRTAGAGGGITGVGGDLLIIDDPHKNWEEAQSATVRESIVEWFKSTFYTRCEPDATIVVVQTRWHEMDLTGWLQSEHDDDWTDIIFPAIAEEDDVLGREVGEALCPERYDEAALGRIERGAGPDVWNGLYQQRPSSPKGNIVKRDHIRYYGGPTGKALPGNLRRHVTSWDMTFKKTKAGSYVCGQVWAESGADVYLLDQARGRWEFTDAQNEVVILSEKWPSSSEVLVEEAANGAAILSSLKRVVRGLIAVNPQGSKEARLQSVAPLFQAGNVWLPHPSIAPWVGPLVEELVTFPRSKYNDQVDCTSQALDRFNRQPKYTNIHLNLNVGAQSNPWSV
jgi:predicted phage terminase large subunit-like protein